MQKENLFFFSFSSESTFEVHLKGTNKRAKNQILFEFFRAICFYPHSLTFYLQALMYRAFDDVREERLSLTLPSHFESHSLTSHIGVRAQSEKSEGDVRENRCPSHALSPLCIGLWGLWCEKVRDIFEYVIFFTSYTSKSGISLSRFVQRLQTMSPKASDS